MSKKIFHNKSIALYKLRKSCGPLKPKLSKLFTHCDQSPLFFQKVFYPSPYRSLILMMHVFSPNFQLIFSGKDKNMNYLITETFLLQCVGQCSGRMFSNDATGAGFNSPQGLSFSFTLNFAEKMVDILLIFQKINFLKNDLRWLPWQTLQ